MSRGKKIWEYAKGLCTKMIKSFGIGTEFSRLPLLQGASGSIPLLHSINRVLGLGSSSENPPARDGVFWGGGIE